jgi:hypothetical protein
VEDLRGLADVGDYVLSVQANLVNRPPVFTSIPVVDGRVNSSYSYQPVIEDRDGDRLNLSLIAAPVGMRIDGTTGTLNWTPLAEQLGEHIVKLALSDTRGGLAEQNFLLRVEPSLGNNQPIIVSAPVDKYEILRGTQPQIRPTSWPDHQGNLGSISGQVFLELNRNEERQLLYPVPTEYIRTIESMAGKYAQGDVVYEEDFEGNIGQEWSDGTITDGGNAFSRFSGRFLIGHDPRPQGNGVYQTLRLATIPGESYLLTYDLYAIDSWDGFAGPYGPDLHYVSVDGFRAVEDIIIGFDPPAVFEGLGFEDLYADRIYRQIPITFRATQSITEIRLGAYSYIPQGFNDESWGLDNVKVQKLIPFLLNNAEPGLDGIVVELVNGDTQAVISSQVSSSWDRDENGQINPFYEQGLFDFGELDAGNYQVRTSLTAPWRETVPEINSIPVNLAVGERVEGLAFGEVKDYLYPVEAVDLDGDILSYSLLDGPEGMKIAPETGKLSWLSPEVGEYAVTVGVKDNRGGEARQSFVVRVEEESFNNAPEIESTPLSRAVVGQSYFYQVEAVDFNLDPLTYELLEAPLGMTIHPNTGLISWSTPELNFLPWQVKVKVTDGRGGEDWETFSLRVEPRGYNQNPAFMTNPVREIELDSRYIYPFQVLEADGDTLEYDLPIAPGGMGINEEGELD